jgi:hypothetical protein
MKKELSVSLCMVMALFLGSCSDYSVTKEEQLDLPADFDWRIYAEINKDVAMSQIVLSVREKNIEYKGDDSAARLVSNCVNLLSKEAFMEKVYLEYAGCPAKGWQQEEKCTGIYANNSNNDKPVLSNVTYGDTTGWRCIIGGCWRGGWDEISDKDAECTGDDEIDFGKDWCSNMENLPKPLKSFVQDSLTKFTGAQTSFAPIRMMCQFLPKAENTEEAEAYLKSFYYLNGNTAVYGTKFDSILVGQHYSFIGRNDGRPYKYCEQGKTGEEKSLALAVERQSYYDYGKNAFCLNKGDDKIYVIKEDK